MKKLTFLAVLVLLSQLVFAGGLLTNGNQSAQYIRMMSRNASLGIDAVYYNPAGLIKLDDGWHFALHNQTIFQTKTVDSQFSLLNDGYYEGAVNVPYFPTAFIVYKKNNLALSFGFGPNGGGGTADYDRGLPSFEIPITKVVPSLAGLTQINPALNVTGYDVKLAFEGSSVFYGLQFGATYKVNDIFSVYGGVRYLPSKNIYAGTIESIQLKVGDTYYPAPTWLSGASGTVSGIAAQASGAATSYTGAANSVQQLITGGAGSFTLAQVQNAGYISSAQRATFEGALSNLGLNSAQIAALNMNQVKTYFSQGAATYAATATQLNTVAGSLGETAGLLGDKEVDAEQTGSGFTPMIGMNISPVENLNIGLKYEMQTKLELTNSTKVDDVGLFPDGEPSRSDLPAILGIGVGYDDGKLEAQFSYTMFFDKGVSWGGNTRDIAIYKEIDPDMIRAREIDKNGFEAGLGLQYNVTDKFALSIGGLRSNLGVAENFQNDFDNNNSSYSLGGGIEWKITDALVLDAGVLKSFYKDETVSFTDPDIGVYNETYGKNTTGFAIGLSYSIF